MRSPVVCTTIGFAGGGEEGGPVSTVEARGVSEALEASRLLSLRWRG